LYAFVEGTAMPHPMLTDAQCSAINAAVDRILARHPRGIGELHRYATQVLFPALEESFPGIPASSLRVAGLMSLLKPVGGGPPPPILHHDLDRLVERILKATRSGPLKPDELEVQIVVAYGCGWRRRVRNMRQPLWDAAHWADAVMELIVPAKRHVRKICRRLALDVHGFRFPSASDIEHLACYSVGVFVGMRPTGSRVYQQFQSIHNWNPMIGVLHGCLFRAIDGFCLTKGTLQVNRFRNSILFPVLAGDGLLSIAKAAYWDCPDCRRRTEYGVVGGAPCNHCGSDGEPHVIAITRLIYPDAYTTIPFWKCRKPRCDAYARDKESRCARCGGTLSPRSTHLHVRKHLIA
jgi:hypothetical protein